MSSLAWLWSASCRPTPGFSASAGTSVTARAHAGIARPRPQGSTIVTHDIETADGFDRCAWLMDADDSAGIKSSFQVVPEDRYSVAGPRLDAMRARGFEINVHDLNHDGRLFSSREEFLRRVKK